MAQEKIKSYKDLLVWQEAHKLALLVYRATKEFPPDERYGLADQLRRAAVSATSNLAEGFGRDSYKDRLHFYCMARGSLYEVDNQIQLAKDIGYISQGMFAEINVLTSTTMKLLNGFITSTRKFVT